MSNKTRKPNGYWTFERCKEEALKYKYRTDFYINSNGAYNNSRKNNWLNCICSHMKEKRKPLNHWTFERCKEEALKYNTKKDFEKNTGSGYMAALKNNWLGDICTHMGTIGHKYERCIYVYEFSDNNAYIGLTYNLDKRHKERLCNKKDTVTKHIKETGLEPIRKQLTKYVDVVLAQQLEGEYVNIYKEKGWVILNKAKTGGVGSGIIKWTKEKCVEEALKYKNRSDFCVVSNGAYIASIRNNWLDDVCLHMKELQKPKGYWTNEKCKEEALRYNTKTDFRNKSQSAYSISKKNKWLDSICGHMHRPKHIKWTYAKCKEEALKYNLKSHFKKNNRSAFNSANNNNWINEICSHMKKSN